MYAQIAGISTKIVDDAIKYHKKISEYEHSFRGDNKNGESYFYQFPHLFSVKLWINSKGPVAMQQYHIGGDRNHFIY